MAEYDVAIVGGGLAGLTAAMFSGRYGLKTAVLDPMGSGGQVINEPKIEDYPGLAPSIAGYELGPVVSEQALASGAELVPAYASSLEVGDEFHTIRHETGAVSATSVIIACGSKFAALGVPGEQEFDGRGVSHCASCDGPFSEGKTVGIVGGGDSALRAATILSPYTKEVLIFVRDTDVIGQRALVEEVVGLSNVRILRHHGVVEIYGDSVVTSVLAKDYVSGETTSIELASIFIYVGLEPNSGWLMNSLSLDDRGHILTDLEMKTAVPGVFAAGDIRQLSARQLVTAAGDGATAAIAANRHVAARRKDA